MRGKKRFTTIFKSKAKRALLFGCVFFPTALFAQSEASLREAATVDLLQNIISVASWIWVIPATFAGKFMTNYFIYGDSFYLANYLFKFWQTIRTFAYFALGFYFLGSILYMRFHDAEAKSGIADLIKNTIIGGFLIGWSRWLIASAVDLSIIFTSAVASIPSQIYAQNRTITKQQCFYVPSKVDVKDNLTVDPVTLSKTENRKPVTWADIAPDGSNIAGPLTFFGSSVLGFFDMVFLPEGAKDGNEIRINSAAFIIVAVKAIMALMLIVPLFILVIVNIIRIVYLWIRIVFSPFIVLMNVFDMKISEGLQKYIDRKNILGLILQPVAVVGMLSVGLILVIELTSIFNLCVSEKNGADPLQGSSLAATIKQNDVVPVGDDLFNVKIDASLSQLGDTLGGITGELILAGFVIILLWSLLKVGFSFADLTAGLAKDITKSTEEMIGTIPIVKLPGGGSVGTGAISKLARNGFGLDNKLRNIQETQQQNILDRVGLGDGMIKRQEVGALQQLAKKGSTTLVELQKQITEKISQGKISSADAKEIVKTWLSGTGKSDANNQKILNDLGIGTLKNMTKDDIAKLRTEENENTIAARKLLNRLFTNGKIKNADKMDVYGGGQY